MSKEAILHHFGQNFRPFFERYGIRFVDRKRETLVRCPWHIDRHPSLSINSETGQFHCHAGCGSGDAFDFYARRHGLSAVMDFPRLVEAITNDFGLAERRGSKGSPGVRTLLTVHPLSAELRAWLTAQGKVYSETTLAQFGLGEGARDGERCLIFPINAKLQKLYFWDRRKKSTRWQYYPRAQGYLIGEIGEIGEAEEVVLCEGEWDFLMLWDRGFRAIATGTTGAGHLPKGLAQRLAGKDIVIVYDRDAAGRQGAERAAERLAAHTRSVKIAQLPDSVGDGGDVSDYFQKLGRSAAEFYEEVVRPAKPFDPTALVQAEVVAVMSESPEDQRINPAQDVVNGVLHYAVATRQDPSTRQTTIFLLTAERRLVTVADYEAQGFVFTSKTVQRPRLSKSATERFLKGEPGMSVSALHDTIRAYIERYVALRDPRVASLLALWTLGTYVHQVFRYFPYLWVHSVVKACGKTLLMEILRPLVFNGLAIVSPSLASLFRYIADGTPTLLMDEMEWLGAMDKERYGHFMAILNAGFNVTFSVSRAEFTAPGRYDNTRYSTYCPKVLAGLKELENTLRDRTIRINLIRKDQELVRRYRATRAVREEHQQVRDALYRFGLTYATELARLYETAEELLFLQHLQGRELDLWEPILILAHLVDQDRGEAGVLENMQALSLQSLQSKQQEDREAIEVVQVLIVWQDLITTLIPDRTEGDVAYYRQDRAFEFFKASEPFGWMETPKPLTIRLRRIHIPVERRRVERAMVRFYAVRRSEFNDLYRCLVPPETPERSVPND